MRWGIGRKIFGKKLSQRGIVDHVISLAYDGKECYILIR
jgi:hypothetical protein